MHDSVIIQYTIYKTFNYLCWSSKILWIHRKRIYEYPRTQQD